MHDPARAKHPFASVTEAPLRAMQHTKQKEDENLIDYVTRFKSAKNVLKSHVGSEVLHKFIEHTEDYRAANAAKQQEMKDESFNNWMAFLLMRNSDQKKHGSLTAGLSSQRSMGHNQCPKTIAAATDILANHKHDNCDPKRRNRGKQNEDTKEKDDDKKNGTGNEQSFAQGNIACCCCGKNDHKSPDCPDKDKIPKEKWFQRKACQNYLKLISGEDDDQSSSQDDKDKKPSGKTGWSGLHVDMSNLHQECDCSMAHKSACKDMKDCIILDNGSTLSLFANPELVKNMRQTDDKLLLATNAGMKENNKKAHVPEFGDVWFDQDAIANIFGFADVKKKHRITCDSDKEDAFLVHTKEGIVKFEASPQGLCRHKVSENYRNSLKDEIQETSNIVATVAENRKNCTQRQFDRAKMARKLYHNLGTPTVQNFKSLLKANMIANCPVMAEDVNIAEKIFGPSVSSLKGKSARTTPKPVRADVIEIPPELIEKHREIELCMDAMCVNKEGMLTAIDRTIKFRSLVPIDSKVKAEHCRALDVILRKCNSAGFVIKMTHCDGEYRSMMDEVKDNLDVDVNCANAFDHVPEAERNNRTIKERVRAACHRLPCKKLPRVMMRYLAMVQTNQLNFFPVKGGISSHCSPRTILGGTPLDCDKHCVIPFGACVQANHESNPTNDNTARTIDCICLRPCNNVQGGHELMDLNSGRVIARGGKITEIPVTNVVIKAVEAMAEKEGFKSLKFKNRHGVVFFDTDWIAGVDCHLGDQDQDDEEVEDQDQDDECEPDEDDNENEDEDEESQEEINQNEIDELLAEAEDDMANPMEQQDNDEDQDEDRCTRSTR